MQTPGSASLGTGENHALIHLVHDPATVYQTPTSSGLNNTQTRQHHQRHHEGKLAAVPATPGVKKIAVVLGVICCLLALGFVAVGAAWWGCEKESSAPHPDPIELYCLVPLHKQDTPYTCGPSSAVSVFRAFGFNSTEHELALEMGSTPSQGTNWSAVLQAGMRRGFETRIRINATTADLKTALQNGRLTVIGLQSWKGTSEPPYSQEWEKSHYAVIMGYNATGVFLMDPSQAEGYYGYIGYDRFLTMWHFNTKCPTLFDSGRYYGLSLTFWLPGKTVPLVHTPPLNVRRTD